MNWMMIASSQIAGEYGPITCASAPTSQKRKRMRHEPVADQMSAVESSSKARLPALDTVGASARRGRPPLWPPTDRKGKMARCSASLGLLESAVPFRPPEVA